MRIIVIGGGAGGFFGAINRALVAPQDEVILLEAAQPLAKVRISGGGRCNVTHHCFEPAQLVQNYPRGGRALRGAFTRFAPQDTVAWFRHQGVILKTEADGRMFPVSDSSQTIVDCLLSTAKRLGVKILVGMAVKQVEQGFRIILKNGQVWESDRLLLATGSNPSGYRFAQALGHTIIPPVPSLFTFTISDPRLQGLAASHYQHPLTINWVPEHNAHSLRELFLQTKQDSPKKKILGYAPVSLPRRFWQQILTYLGIKPETLWADFSKSHLQQLTEELTQGRYQVQGKGVFKEEFVTCGGVDLKEVNFKTMESKLCLGLFFAGEVLDIDGVTGGFNFQSAWTTAWLAAQSMG
jgi:predicted flavoprotein YhiN